MSFLNTLLADQLLYSAGSPGIYGKGAAFERIVRGLEQVLDSYGDNIGAEAVFYPPVISRETIVQSGYYNSFPNLLAGIRTVCNCEFHPSTLDAWEDASRPSDLVLTPAACYPLYPLLAKRGPIAHGGTVNMVQSFCFRAEPSSDPYRQQSFRMREFVRVGSSQDVEHFREDWYVRAQKFIEDLQLSGTRVVANDPFFGDEGSVLKAYQRDRELKYEFALPVSDGGAVACISFNNHLDSFARKWNITFQNSHEEVHSGCVAFGLERLALALIYTHGRATEFWPEKVTRLLFDHTDKRDL